MRRTERADRLFDYLADRPDGVTKDDMMADLGWSFDNVTEGIRSLRLILAGDTLTLTCDPNGANERWLYKLVATLDAAQPWVVNRVTDQESRVETMVAVMAPIVKATDGRTLPGKKARMIHRSQSRLLEDLRLLAEDAGLFDPPDA